MKTQTYGAFGWRIDRVSLAAGETFKSVMAEDTDSRSLVNMTLYTKGVITGKHSNSEHTPEPRVPGFFNSNLPPVLPKGEITFLAESDAEWFCLNYGLNGRRLPNVTVFFLEAGKALLLPVGAKLFVCTGSGILSGVRVSSAQPVEVAAAGASLVAEQDIRGFQFL